MSSDAENPVSLVPGRSCGECSLCCKLLHIQAFDKPVGVWCAHCAPGRGGCTIYETRPAECRNFHCSWLTSPALGPEWRPNKCKMFLRQEGNLIAVHVDPSDPTAWRREPFFQQLKALASRAAGTKQQVAVYIKNRVIVIFPNKEVDVGTMNPGDHLVVRELVGSHGKDWTAFIEAGTGR
jgi:uncharacterized cysteine cluster protein YcgN (CxxCxxCC family)